MRHGFNQSRVQATNQEMPLFYSSSIYDYENICNTLFQRNNRKMTFNISTWEWQLSSAEAAHLVGPIPLQCYRNVFSLLHSGKQTKYPWYRRQRSVSARSFRTKQLILSVFCFVGLGIVPGTSHKLGQRSTTELQSRLAPLQQRLCVIEHFWCALSVAEYWSVWGLDNLTPWFLTFLTVTL